MGLVLRNVFRGVALASAVAERLWRDKRLDSSPLALSSDEEEREGELFRAEIGTTRELFRFALSGDALPTGYLRGQVAGEDFGEIGNLVAARDFSGDSDGLGKDTEGLETTG